jgi:ABC-type uncharacterized transport system involved in gliding motility auxiliary subunit
MKRLDPAKMAVLSVLIAGVLFISVNIISNVWFGNIRADFTAGKAFTTSDALKPVFASITEPVVVRLYYTDAVGALSPRHGAYYQRVRDLLQQYGKMSGGKIKLELFSPEPFSDAEDRAVGFGLQALPLSQEGEVGYFGLAATNSTDDAEIIPFFNLERERFLEYDLAKLIYNLARPTRPRIGYISSLTIDGMNSLTQEQMQQLQVAGADVPPAWAFMSQVREAFTVIKLEPDVTEIPANIDTLMLIQPDNLAPPAQMAVDQFVMRGGKLLAFVDPVAESQGLMIGQSTPGQRRRPGSLAGFQTLLKAWGAQIVEGKVVGDLDAAIRINLGVDGRPMLSDYVAWLHLDGRNFDPNDGITGDLKQINVATAGAIEAVAGAGTTVTPLIMTGPRTQRLNTDQFEGVPNVVGLFRDFQPANKREVLAARITGKAKSAFPTAPAGLKESAQPIQVIVVADTDLLMDRFWVQQSNAMGQRVLVPTADNGNLVITALENLSGAVALSSLNAKTQQNRPFTLLDDIRRDAEQQYRAKEQALTVRLQELQQKADAMMPKADGGGQPVLSDADKKTIESYRSDILATRRELRDVQRSLRESIERLQSTFTFANIGAVPVVFGLILIAVAVARHRRRQRRLSDN